MRRTTSQVVWTVTIFWSFLILHVCHASTSNGEIASTVTPPSSMVVSNPLPSSSYIATCPSRTANYITHNLPQQCLKINWTRSINGTTSAAGEFEEASTDSAATTGVNVTITSSAEDSKNTGPETGVGKIDEDAIHTKSVISNAASIQDATEPKPIPSTSPESTSSGAELESDSPLDNANFLSFEEWKKQMLEKIGQSPENVGQGRASTGDRRKQPSSTNNALDSLGEDNEINLDFGFGPDKHEDLQSRWASQAAEVANGGPSLSDESVTSGSKGKGKDAGTTWKERFNYASFDCAATILKTNPRCKSSSSVLVENKDSYMLNECATENKFIIVELCDDILIDTIVLANFEFFSSMFRTFRVSISDRYPIKMDRWNELGVFEARNSREIQAFAVENPLIWARYLRVEFLTHYGNEYYCPVSLLRVHGTTMMEEFKSQDEAVRGDHDVEVEKLEPPVMIETPKEPSVRSEETEIIFNTAVPAMASNLSEIASSNSQSGSIQSQNVSSSTADARPSTAGVDTGKGGILKDDPQSAVRTSLVEPSEIAHNTSRLMDQETGNATTADPSGLEVGTVIETTSISANGSTATNFTASANSTASKPSQASHDASRNPSSTVQPPAASPTTQESFFKSVHKRLQMLEANSTLSLQYIEEQSRILRDAFTKVEKRQMSKTETFLQHLNDTVIAELKGFRQQYDQLWQSTVIELETNREQYTREMSALSTRLTVMADELVFQKRMAVVQSTLLLLCLGLVLFVRSGSSSLELPLMQQVMSKSHSMLRQPFEYSPPGSLSSRDTSPPRRKYLGGVGSDADMGSPSTPLRKAERRVSKPVIELVMATPSDVDDDELPANDLDAPVVARQTQSGPATPSGTRENQNLLDWPGTESSGERAQPLSSSPSSDSSRRASSSTRREPGRRG